LYTYRFDALDTQGRYLSNTKHLTYASLGTFCET